jgi:hypothetical protein
VHPDNKSNSQVVHADTFQALPLLPNHWPHSLEWLRTLKLVPPPFHESSWQKCSGKTKQLVLSTYGNLLKLACDTSAPFLTSQQCNASSLGNLGLSFLETTFVIPTIGAATTMIICQTKPENLFSIETLCFWAYQNSIF